MTNANPTGRRWLAIIIGAGTVCGFSPATAETDDSGIEEVIVTAQRTAESIQDVPIAVTALDRRHAGRQAGHQRRPTCR